MFRIYHKRTKKLLYSDKSFDTKIEALEFLNNAQDVIDVPTEDIEKYLDVSIKKDSLSV